MLSSPNKIPLLWGVILSLLAVTENGQTLLSDPNYDELIAEQAQAQGPEGATAEARASGCHFKDSLRGSWFQSGIFHAITITRDAISTKGHCVEKEGEKYLMYNRRDNCYRCLVFSEKHLNVLQYKETFCIPEKRSLRQICSTITGDANLYAMFRLEAVPIDCPFKGQFTVSYNRGQGDCAQPPSSMDSCTKSSKLMFNYQACPDVPGTESSVEELQCLASWKEGSSRYFLGLISYQHHASYEERFRCFVYERSKHAGKYHPHPLSLQHHHHNLNLTTSASASTSPSGSDLVYRLSQSGDATCNGLSSMEGARTMILKKVQPFRHCNFPSWIPDRSHWHSLDQGSTYNFHQGNLRVSNFSQNQLAGTSPNSLIMSAICHHQVQAEEKAGLHYPSWYENEPGLVILHVTAECRTGYLCSAFHQRDDNIMEIQFGSIARRVEDACQLSNFNAETQPYVTLVSSLPQRTPCPFPGAFSVSSLSLPSVGGGGLSPPPCRESDEDQLSPPFTPKEDTFTAGCSSPDKIRIRVRSDCDSVKLHGDYHCHSWWSDGRKGITYVVTSRADSQSLRPQRHCFAFRDFASKDDQLDSNSNSDPVQQQEPQLLQFSSYSDSCQRNAMDKGDFSFNLTRLGHCSDINSAPGPKTRLSHTLPAASFILLIFLWKID